MSPQFDVPQSLTENLEKRLAVFSHSLAKPQKLADCIRQLSNLFLKGQVKEAYWADPHMRAAYLSYFSILNFLRSRAVFHEASLRGFLDKTKVVADWGCGAGAASQALVSEWKDGSIPEIVGIDQREEALEEYGIGMKIFNVKYRTQKLNLSKIGSVDADTLIFSYVLNELDEYPQIPASVKRIVVIEPSTHQAGRQMLQWRNDQLQKGWYAWAPCTHQKKCPLLTHSGKDWCHHRIHWRKPDWFAELEKHLPMRNDTLTMSYLLLSRTSPLTSLEGLARVVGDEQEEKGKSRQLICRGETREFLSWLHRDQFSLKLKRGDLIRIHHGEARGNETRIFFAKDVEKVSGPNGSGEKT